MERQAKERPQKECILFENGERWTYDRALLEGYKAANTLSSLGVQRGENVLIFLPNGQEWIRAWWGVTFLGAVMVPVNTAYKGAMLQHVCRDSQARHMITNPDLGERVNEIGLDLRIIDAQHLADGPDKEPRLDTPLEPWDIHGIFYTSGTTGLSKGVIIPYLFNYQAATSWLPMATSEDTFLVDAPFYHLLGIHPSLALWTKGGRIAVRTKFSGTRYLEVVRECNATMACLVGTMGAFLEATEPKPDDAVNPLRVVSPAPMVRDPKAFMARFGIETMTAGFGMTEVPNVTMGFDPVSNPKSCGKARKGVELRLVDDHDIPVPTGQAGELIVRTDLPWEMNAGYWQRPEETARAWRNGWFHTGDLLTCDREGNYYFADRKKDAIRRRGENISSFEVEREVLAHPDVAEAACVGVPGDYGEEEVKVFVVLKEGSFLDPQELIRYLIPRMPGFMVPRFIEIVTELEKTATQRVKKVELRARGNSAATWDRELARWTLGKEG